MGIGGFKTYLQKLIECIEAIEIYDIAGVRYEDYEKGLRHVTELFLETRRKGRHLFFIGNGGSAAIASHMTVDFMKNGRMKTYSLYDSSLITCMGNDYGYEYIFSYPLKSLGEEKDLLVAVSSSGNSEDIVNAIQVAKEKGMTVITLSGFRKENRMIGMGIYNIYVPVEHYGMVESIHNLMLQQIVDALMENDN